MFRATLGSVLVMTVVATLSAATSSSEIVSPDGENYDNED
jgi:hypothetical protein